MSGSICHNRYTKVACRLRFDFQYYSEHIEVATGWGYDGRLVTLPRRAFSTGLTTDDSWAPSYSVPPGGHLYSFLRYPRLTVQRAECLFTLNPLYRIGSGAVVVPSKAGCRTKPQNANCLHLRQGFIEHGVTLKHQGC